MHTQPHAGPISHSLRRILIVDDDDDLVWSSARLLKLEFGCEIDAVGSGAAAIDRACEWQPSVVIMDIQMPGIDGIEAARLMRALFVTPRMPYLIALTGLCSATERQRILEAGFDAFLPKPLDLAVLSGLLAMRPPRGI